MILKIVDMTRPTKKLGETDLKILTLIKAMYKRGCTFAKNKDEISRMLAIHAFDNAVEMTLKLLVKIKDSRPIKNKKDFGFYDLTNSVYKEGVLKIQIEGLHEQRNRIHHHADIPASETVVKYQGYVEDFLKGVYQKDIGLLYEEISLGLLIDNSQLRELFQKAENSFENEKYAESIGYSEEMFCKAVFDAGDIFSKAGILTGYFKGGNELGEIIKDTYAEKYKNSDHYEFAKEVSKAFLQLGMSSTVMQFFDEYRIDFLRHRKRVENIDQISEEKLKSEAQESLNFVLNVTLKWQEEKIL